jgi:hypothetical protein
MNADNTATTDGSIHFDTTIILVSSLNAEATVTKRLENTTKQSILIVGETLVHSVIL